MVDNKRNVVWVCRSTMTFRISVSVAMLLHLALILAFGCLVLTWTWLNVWGIVGAFRTRLANWRWVVLRGFSGLAIPGIILTVYLHGETVALNIALWVAIFAFIVAATAAIRWEVRDDPAGECRFRQPALNSSVATPGISRASREATACRSVGASTARAD